jgi:hypothetical protein
MSGIYFHPIKRIFLNLSGGTVTGDTGIREASTLIGSGATLQDLQGVMSIGSTSSTASDVVIKATGGNIISFESDTASLIVGDSLSASSLSMSGDITPDTDNAYDIGTPVRRFRTLNTVNGVAVNFTASTRIKTAQIELGNTIVTENNIILSGNTIDGGDW